MIFESTLPLDIPDLIRASAFRRYAEESTRDGDSLFARLSLLGPSMAEDLMRFESARRPGEGLEALEVLAACVRHACSLLLQLQEGERVIPLTVFPTERLVHCPVPMDKLLAGRLTELQVLRVEQALLRAPGNPDTALVGAAEHYAPLGPFLWELALRGAREELLPEIGGNAAYRIAPAMDLRGLNHGGSLAAAVARLTRQTTNLREISEWPGFDRARATRLLNALYLQQGLMVTRTHPAAKNAEGWFSGSSR